MPTVADAVAYLDAFAPPSGAADWDNVGLILGDPAAALTRVLTCLTVTPEVVAEAMEGGVELIVAHHPVLFKPVKKLTAATADGRLLLPLLSHGVAVYSPHTAFDNCAGGINDGLAARLGLTNVRPLRPDKPAVRYKLVAFVPADDLSRVSDALFAAGAGHIGAYRECSFRADGTGTFFGTDAANPTVGVKGRREEVRESRLEVVVPEARLAAAVAALRGAHSYEEPAFDIYPLRTFASSVSGAGRVGDLPDDVMLADLGETLRLTLHSAGMQYVGARDGLVKRVAVACGAAGEYLADAIRAKADVFVTGELRFHDGLAAQAAGISVLLPGHYATERPGVEDLAVRLQAAFPTLHVTASAAERDPFGVLA